MTWLAILGFLFGDTRIRVMADEKPLPYYTMRPVHFPGAYVFMDCIRINDHGHVVALGYAMKDGRYYLLLHDSEGTHRVRLPEAQYYGPTLITGFNNRGDVVGVAGYRGFLYRAGRIISLSNRTDGVYFTRLNINRRGLIVGTAQPAEAGPTYAFTLKNGREQVFGGLVERANVFGVAANNRGLVVGGAQVVSGAHHTLDYYHAVVFEQNGPRDLGTLANGSLSMATDINERGDVLGFSTKTNDSTWYGFVFRDETMQELLPLPGDLRFQACGINNRGDIVGSSGPHDFDESLDRAVLNRGGLTYDLNHCMPPSEIWLRKAYAINARGAIAATTSRGGVVVLKPDPKRKSIAANF